MTEDTETDDGTNRAPATAEATPRIGVCYFPEHWPRERWETDVEQMVEAGIDVVRMGEFSWGRLEPERGEFDFEWLDTAVSLLSDAGIDVVLCTPTATPPKWLIDEHPEILQVEPDGTTREFGSRRHYCFNSEVYREETERIARTMAERYADVDAVVGWQTDNEYGCHETVRCYCEDCASGFREWCRDRYGDVETLNETWGTAFWSQQVGSFEELDPPRHTAAEHHPSRLLDYARFANASVVDYNELQAEIIREANDEWFVTHNFMGHFDTLDSFSVGDSLDFATWDSYPTGFAQDRNTEDATADRLRAGDPDQVSLNHDLYRGPNGFWVMEQQPGDVNWPPRCPQPGEGAMRLWAHQAVAHGANVVSYFRWRRCREGQEQYHAGLRKHDGSPDRGYEDATRAAAEFGALGDLDAVDAPVALCFSYDDLWALDEQPHAPEFDYWGLVGAFYRALRARGIQVDVVDVSPGTEPSFDGYAAVVAPTVHLADESLADAFEGYVDDGGHLLLGPRTGYKLPGNKLQSTLAPGPFADLVGGRVDQHESLPGSIETRLTYRGEGYDFWTWAEWLTPEDGTAVGEYASGVASGRSAVLENEVGAGSVTYCGVWPEADLADALVVDLLDRGGVSHGERFPETVRVAERDGYVWLLNFGGEPVTVDAPDDAEWRVGSESLPAFGVGVVEADVASLSVR
ncbi:beta-galactosidase [Halobellus rufus]|uniref:beta-galactosidase n=1 Tax=Halobellus rufus TaxID=1448860 RepID=UPI0009DE0B29|nr:beta-galactosidase [Halobellus rufus]